MKIVREIPGQIWKLHIVVFELFEIKQIEVALRHIGTSHFGINEKKIIRLKLMHEMLYNAHY